MRCGSVNICCMSAGRVLHQQAFDHAGLGLARRIDAELDCFGWP